MIAAFSKFFFYKLQPGLLYFLQILLIFHVISLHLFSCVFTHESKVSKIGRYCSLNNMI